jgi:hypothetical protein
MMLSKKGFISPNLRAQFIADIYTEPPEQRL